MEREPYWWETNDPRTRLSMTDNLPLNPTQPNDERISTGQSYIDRENRRAAAHMKEFGISDIDPNFRRENNMYSGNQHKFARDLTIKVAMQEMDAAEGKKINRDQFIRDARDVSRYWKMIADEELKRRNPAQYMKQIQQNYAAGSDSDSEGSIEFA